MHCQQHAKQALVRLVCPQGRRFELSAGDEHYASGPGVGTCYVAQTDCVNSPAWVCRMSACRSCRYLANYALELVLVARALLGQFRTIQEILDPRFLGWSGALQA
jgi:hypothetical protein